MMQGTYTPGRTFFKEYRTRSGKTAKVEINLDGGTVEVSISAQPAGNSSSQQ